MWTAYSQLRVSEYGSMERQTFYSTNPSYWRNSVSLFASQHCCLKDMAEVGRV